MSGAALFRATCVALFCLTGFNWAWAGRDVPRAATLDFVRDGAAGSKEPALTDFSRAVQASLLNDTRVAWVEREELSRIVRETDQRGLGGHDSANAVRLGRWLQADLLLRGEITENPTGSLTLELIDLKHAELLARKTVAVAFDGEHRLVPTALQIAAAGEAGSAALTEGLAALRARTNRRTVAPLYFQNISQSPRLDFAEGKLAGALENAIQSSPTLHLLKFPHAISAQGEAELVLAGLTDADPDAWQHAADAYIWGTIEEKGAPDMDFASVPVTLSLQVWSGVGPPTENRWEGPVADLSEGIAAVTASARQLMMAAPPQKERDPAERDRVALAVTQRAREISARLSASSTVSVQTVSGRSSSDFLRSEQGKKLAAYRQRLLEIAAFLRPLDADAQRNAAAGRKVRAVDYHSISAHWRRLEKAESERNNADGALNGEAFARAVNEAYELGQRLQGRDLPTWYANGPQLTTPERAQLRAMLARTHEEHLRQLVVLVQVNPPATRPAWLVKLLSDWITNMPVQLASMDPVDARRTLETIWPYFKPELGRVLRDRTLVDSTFPSPSEVLVSCVIGVFDAFGNTDRSTAMLNEAWLAYEPEVKVRDRSADANGTGKPALRPWSKKPASAATFAAKIREIELWPKVLLRQNDASPAAPLEKIPFRVVDDLTWHEGRLWIAESTRLSLPKELGFENAEGNHFLWSYDPSLRSSSLATSRLGSHPTIRTMLSDGEQLWLGFEGAGVWRWNPDMPSEPRRFGGEEGLLTLLIEQAQRAGQQLVFLGGGQRAMLMQFDRATERWTGLAGLPSGGRSVALSDARLRGIAYVGDWLGFADGEPIFYNFSTKSWRQLVHPLVLPRGVQMSGPPRFIASAISSDERGFWLGREDTLQFLDPNEPAQARDLHVPGFPVAMAHDGRWLWVLLEAQLETDQQTFINRYQLSAGNAGRREPSFTRLALIDKQAFTCVGVLTLPAPEMRNLAVANGRLWIGGSTLLEVIPDIPDRTPRVPPPPPHDGNHPLHRAAWLGDLEQVNTLLNANSDPNRSNAHGWTPLLSALDAGHTAVASSLLAHRADPNLAAEDGTTPLVLAVQRENRAQIDLLLSAGARPDQPLPGLIAGIAHTHTMIAPRKPPASPDRAPQQPAAVEATIYPSGDVLLTWQEAADDAEFYRISRQTNHGPVTEIAAIFPYQGRWVDHTALQALESGEKPAAPRKVTYWLEAVNHANLKPNDTIGARVEITLNPSARETPHPALEWGAPAGNITSPTLNDFRTPLMIASANGATEIVRLLLDHGADPNFQDAAGRTPLLLAVRHGASATAHLLLDHKANPILPDAAGQTPLMATYQRHEDEALLRRMATMLKEIEKRRGVSPLLFEAAKTGQSADLALLVSLGGDLHATLKGGESVLGVTLKAQQWETAAWMFDHGYQFPATHTIDGKTPAWQRDLVEKVMLSGSTELLSALIERGLSVNTTIYGLPLAAYAAQKNQYAIAALLKARGANLGAPSDEGKRPADYATTAEMQRLLGRPDQILWTRPKNLGHRRGTPVNEEFRPDGKTALEGAALLATNQLLQACKIGDEIAARQALDAGAWPDSRDEQGMTPLTYALRLPQTSLAKFLVQQGASLNYATQKANFPLAFACERGDVELVDYLISRGAIINAHGDGFTPLIVAARKNNLSLATALLAAGADPNLCSGGTSIVRQNPLAVALAQGNEEMVALLLAAGANPKARMDNLVRDDNDQLVWTSRSLLMFAAESGKLELVKKMLALGQDPKFRSVGDYDALTIAVRSGSREVVAYLLPLSHRSGPALAEALKGNHNTIVDLLRSVGYRSP